MGERPAYIHGFREFHKCNHKSMSRKRPIEKSDRKLLACAVDLVKKREEAGAKTWMTMTRKEKMRKENRITAAHTQEKSRVKPQCKRKSE